MPRLTDIERFKKDLAGLSRESEVLERWGEVREDPPLPEGSDVPPAKPAPTKVLPKPKPRPAPVADDEGLPPDFATLLADLPLDADAALAEAGGPPPEATDTDISDLDLDALLGPPPTPDSESDLEDLGAESSEGLVDFTDRSEALPGLGDEAAEIGASAGLEAGYTGPGLLDQVPEELEEVEDLEAEAPVEDASAEPLQGLADFDLPAQAEAEVPSDFSMPELGDFDAADLGAADLGAADFGALESGIVDEGAAAEPLDQTPDEFSLPDLEESDLHEAEAEALPEEAVPAEAADAPAAAAAAGSSLDSFSIDDFAIPDESPSSPSQGGDAFDGFSLDASPQGGFDAAFGSDADFGGGGLGPVDLDSQLAALGEEVSPAGTFNLDKDWGAGFEVPGEAEEKAAPKAQARPRPVSAPTEAVREVSLTEAQVDKLQDRLLSYPLNLRLAVEDCLANERGTPAQGSRLVWALVERKPFDDVANLVSKILKRRISIPSGYEKSTGADFQAEQGSFRYLLAHTIMPILRIALLVLVAAGILGFLGWKFIYTPLAADARYRSGYARIAEDRYAEAEKSFEAAGRLKEMIPWYYRYAEAYAAKRQNRLAEKKYADLLHRHPGELKGALAWASLERDQLKYAEGVKVLDDWVLVGPSKDPETGKVFPVELDYLNKDALLLEGDIYLDWADEDPRHFEDARRTYASLIQNYGMEDRWLERMLLYFIRTDKLKEVLPLKTHFLAVDELFPSASTLAELGGYLFDKDLLEDVNRILVAAQAKDRLLPEAHYHLARYFLKSNSPAEEQKALGNAIMTFGRLQTLSPRREAMYIDSYIRRANAEFGTRQYIAAETDYAAAAAEYQKALDLGRIKTAPRFAAAYAGLGQVAYWQRDDLSSALSWFEKAAAEGFDSPELRYERGYIHYRQGRVPEAVEQLYVSGSGGHESPYLLYAFGNALYARKDWSAAEAYFRRTVAAMETELEQINLPVPSEKASHAEIHELLMNARNDLGAALLKTATRSGDAGKRAQAVQAFTESTRLFDSLSRDMVAMRRPVLDKEGKPRNLGLENLNMLLAVRRGQEPALYTDLERGPSFPRR